MSRSGYTDDDNDPLALGRWRQAVKRAIEGKRGQSFLRELLDALDAMPDKRLWPHSFASADGQFCTLGVLGARRGIRMDDLGDADDCDPELVGHRFGIAAAMAAEIMYLNDEMDDECLGWEVVEICGPQRGYQRHQRSVRIQNPRAAKTRWSRMRAWVIENLKTPNV